MLWNDLWHDLARDSLTPVEQRESSWAMFSRFWFASTTYTRSLTRWEDRLGTIMRTEEAL